MSLLSYLKYLSIESWILTKRMNESDNRNAHNEFDLESAFISFFHKNVATHFQAGLGNL